MTLSIFSRLQSITAGSLRGTRKYFYLLVLVIGACFTDSPNGREQLMIALPLIVAFEVFLLLMGRFRK